MTHACFPRAFAQALSGAALALGLMMPLASWAQAAQTAPPAQQKNQVAGYQRMMLGQFEITALYDGFLPVDQAILHGATKEDIDRLMAGMFVPKVEGGVQTAVNAYIVNTGEHLILVDAGAAGCFGPTAGSILGNLKAAGYAPAQIDTVLLTHLHGDHACGITGKDGAAIFPNATVYVEREEAAYWLDPATAAKAPAGAKPFFTMAQQAVAPYEAKQGLKQFDAGAQLMPGVKSWPLPGHTPGHAGFLFSSGDQDILFWGDIVHNHAVQFARPEVSIEFDTNSTQAVETRKKIFAQAASRKIWIAGAHLPFPGIGHVVNGRNDAYIWVPLEYKPL